MGLETYIGILHLAVKQNSWLQKLKFFSAIYEKDCLISTFKLLKVKAISVFLTLQILISHSQNNCVGKDLKRKTNVVSSNTFH